VSEQRRQTRVEDPEINVEGDWAAVYNISIGGMCLVSTESVKVGWYRNFTLTDRRSGMSCEISGQVRWVTSVGQGLTRAGIQWVNLDPEKYNWLAFQMRAQLPRPSSDTVLPFEPARPPDALLTS
jgi:hypothetical protein